MLEAFTWYKQSALRWQGPLTVHIDPWGVPDGDPKADLAFVPIGGTYTMDPQEAAGAVKEIAPKVAVPYHFGFVVGSPSFGDDFVKAIAPIKGEVMKPVNPFEQA